MLPKETRRPPLLGGDWPRPGPRARAWPGPPGPTPAARPGPTGRLCSTEAQSGTGAVTAFRVRRMHWQRRDVSHCGPGPGQEESGPGVAGAAVQLPSQQCEA